MSPFLHYSSALCLPRSSSLMSEINQIMFKNNPHDIHLWSFQNSQPRHDCARRNCIFYKVSLLVKIRWRAECIYIWYERKISFTFLFFNDFPTRPHFMGAHYKDVTPYTLWKLLCLFTSIYLDAIHCKIFNTVLTIITIFKC